ncbi:unnamed protein product [Camellia sinensis]
MVMVRDFLFVLARERMNHCPFYGSSGGGISHHLSWILNWNLTVRYTLLVFFQILESLLVYRRMLFSSCTEFPCFEPSPQAQTILHYLLRLLLQRDKSEEALLLAQLSVQNLIFPIARSGFLLQYLMLKFPVLQEKLMADIGQICFLLPEDQRSCLRNASNRDGTGQQLQMAVKLVSEQAFSSCERNQEMNGEKQAQDIRDIKKSMKDINEIKEMITAMSIKYDQVASRVYESHQEIEETSQADMRAGYHQIRTTSTKEYLQREMYGSAQLENFASGFELIGKKELLFDLFQHDMLLWKACSMTLQFWSWE